MNIITHIIAGAHYYVAQASATPMVQAIAEQHYTWPDALVYIAITIVAGITLVMVLRSM